MLFVDGVEYKTWTPSSEEELEIFVEDHSKKIFGDESLYFPVKTKLKSLGGIGSIPDGYAITLSKPYKWFIIEVELSTHPIFNHIVPQLNKFVQGLEDPRSRKNISEALYNEIKNDVMTEAYVKEKIGSGEIYRFVSSTIDNNPTLVVIIDEKTKELEEACNSIPIVKKEVLEFKIFERIDAGIKNAFLFQPLYEQPEKKDQKEGITKVDETVPREGIDIFFIYKGKRHEALFIDSRKLIYENEEYSSPSALSVAITGTARNGWRDWKFVDKQGNVQLIDILRSHS